MNTASPSSEAQPVQNQNVATGKQLFQEALDQAHK